MRCRFMPLMSMLLVLGGASCANAFESDEHRTVSDDAFMIAKTRVEALHSTQLSQPDAAVLWGFLHGLEWQDEEGDRGTEGRQESAAKQIAQDLRESRRVPIVKDGAVLTYGMFVALADYMMDPLVQFRVWGDVQSLPSRPSDLSREFLEYLPENSRAMLQASHHNNAHFQEGALRTYWWWHRFAVMIAAYERNLFSALLLNAYADHFLEDFFAPGHIQTYRQDLHDVAALGVHDLYNEKGGSFEIQNWRDLRPLASHADASLTQASARRIAALSRAVDAGMTTVELYGDDLIDKSPMQYPLMVLIVSRSVSDVLDSFATGKVTNSFTSIEWKSRRYAVEGFENLPPREAAKYAQTHDVFEPPAAGIPFGGYRLEQKHARRITYSPVLALSAEFQGMVTSKEDQGRGIVHLEVMPLGVPPEGNFLRSATGDAIPFWLPQTGIGMGYSLVVADGYTGHGPELRLGFPIAKLDSQLSIGGGARNYIGRGRNVWRPNAGLGFEMGFGLLFARVGVGYDHVITSNGDVESGVAFTGGISALAPFSLIRGLFEGPDH